MTTLIANAVLAPLLAEPSIRAEQVNQVVLGETAEVLERNGEWLKVRTDTDAYTGWTHAGYFIEVEESAAEHWRTNASGWSEGAAVRIGGAHISIPLRAQVILEDDTVRLPDGRRGRVVAGCVREKNQAVAAARAKAPERWAFEHFLGSPYQWGGVTPWGVDCSGLVQTTFAARGVLLPRDSAQQVDCGSPVPLEEPRPGDLLFFRSEAGARISHVAFAGEADTLVHSTLACGGTLVEPWLPGSRAAILRERLVAVRRMEDR
ncbi:MAG TPA: SH3 domain-containing C40 family peptidase [Gemmatimonadales bacterium]|nr:SH3 domain-containing C40 family peptidase [Gemmatimonadales bacterium]